MKRSSASSSRKALGGREDAVAYTFCVYLSAFIRITQLKRVFIAITYSVYLFSPKQLHYKNIFSSKSFGTLFLYLFPQLSPSEHLPLVGRQPVAVDLVQVADGEGRERDPVDRVVCGLDADQSGQLQVAVDNPVDDKQRAAEHPQQDGRPVKPGE